MNLLNWLTRFVVFFGVLVLALNNQHEVSIRGFSGAVWSLSLAWALLIALCFGAVIGVLIMVPPWVKERKKARSLIADRKPTANGADTGHDFGI